MGKTSAAVGLTGLAAIVLSACSPDRPPLEQRLERFSDGFDSWTYYTDDQGRISRVKSGTTSKVWDFDWRDSGIDIRGSDTFELEFGPEGMVSDLTDSRGNRYRYEYDRRGYMTSVLKNGNTVASMKMTGGNTAAVAAITQDVSGRDSSIAFCDYHYREEANSCGIHSVLSGRSGIPRWLLETGLFGRATERLPAGYRWNDDGRGGSFEYVFDADGNVIRQVIAKDDGSLPETMTFVWRPSWHEAGR